MTGDAKRWDDRHPVTPEKQRGGRYVPLPDRTLGADYIVRAVELYRAGKLPIILINPGAWPVYYLSENRADPWGGAIQIGHDAFREMIDRLDPAGRKPERIEPKRETFSMPVTKYRLVRRGDRR